MIKQLRRRLALVCTGATCLILTAMAGASLWLSQTQLMEKGNAAFDSAVNAILFHIRSQQVLDYTWIAQTEAAGGLILNVESGGQAFQYAQTHRDQQREQLIRTAGDIAGTAYGFDPQFPPSSRIQADEIKFTFQNDAGEGYHAAAVKIPLDEKWASVIVIKSKVGEKRELMLQRLAFGGFTFFAAILLFGFSWIFTGRTLRPIIEAQRKQAEFISAASHELRSPLAVVQASISAMDGAPPEKAAQFLNTAASECTRMSRLIGDLLLLAGTDSGSWVLKRENTELDFLILDTCEHFEPIAMEKRIRLSVSLPEDPLPRCFCDPGRIIQILSILLDNAISYTPENGKILVSAGICRNGISLSVADNGPGIPDREKEQVFQRFYRRDPARSSGEHFGLGLCIAKEFTSLHQGKMEIRDTPGGGTTFIVSLPVGLQES